MTTLEARTGPADGVETPAIRPLAFLLLILGLWLFFVLTMDLRLRIYDEGLILTGAMEVGAGAVPHRDFYANYGPANFYVLAGLFKIFGPSFLAARLWDALLRALIAAVMIGLLRPRCSRGLTLGAAILGIALLCGRDYLSPNLPVLLCGLVSTGIIAGKRSAGRLCFAGVLTGLAALYRYDTGFFILLAHAAGLAVLLFMERGRDGRVSEWFRAALFYVAGTAIVFLPFAIPFLLGGGLPGFLNDIVDYPLHYYRTMRGLPFPTRPSPSLIVYLPFLAPLAVIAALVLGRTPVREFAARDRGAFAFLVLFAALTGAFLLKGLVRVSPDHMMMAIMASLILLAALAAHWALWTRHVRGVLILLGLFAAGPILFNAARPGLASLRFADRMPLGALLHLGRAPPGVDEGNPQVIANPVRATVPAALPGSALAELAPEALCAAEFVNARTGADERIFVGTMRHDKLFVNMIELYYVAGRRPGTHWYHFDPGTQTREDVQRQMVADLERNGVRWAIRDASFDGMTEPNASAISSGVHILDDHLASTFRPVIAFGNVSVWARLDVAPDTRGWQDCVSRKRAASGPRGLVGRLLG